MSDLHKLWLGYILMSNKFLDIILSVNIYIDWLFVIELGLSGEWAVGVYR